MNTKKNTEAGTITTTKHYGREGLEDSEVEKLEVQTFETEPAFVRANFGLTINLGNYESARVDTSVTLPCYVEEIDEAYKKAIDTAAKKTLEQEKIIQKWKQER